MMLNLFNPFFFKRFFTFLFFALMVCSSSVQAERCTPLKNNYYEDVYCQIKHKGQGHSLPNIYEFRKNNVLTQAFLLKRPAARAGIDLKIPERKNKETIKRQENFFLKKKLILGKLNHLRLLNLFLIQHQLKKFF